MARHIEMIDVEPRGQGLGLIEAVAGGLLLLGLAAWLPRGNDPLPRLPGAESLLALTVGVMFGWALFLRLTSNRRDLATAAALWITAAQAAVLSMVYRLPLLAWMAVGPLWSAPLVTSLVAMAALLVVIQLTGAILEGRGGVHAVHVRATCQFGLLIQVVVMLLVGLAHQHHLI